MKRVRKMVAVVVLMTLLANNHQDAGAASDGTYMTKVLKYYAKGNYKKANKYGKKMRKVAKETCEKKMSSKMKRAYRKVVKKYRTYHQAKEGQEYLQGYYLTDIDNDKKTDLLIEYGAYNTGIKLILYQYKKGKAVKIASTEGGYCTYSAYPNHKGIVRRWCHAMEEQLSVLTLKKGKIKAKTIGWRESEGDGDDLLTLGCTLKSHVSYKSGRMITSYKDLR